MLIELPANDQCRNPLPLSAVHLPVQPVRAMLDQCRNLTQGQIYDHNQQPGDNNQRAFHSSIQISLSMIPNQDQFTKHIIHNLIPSLWLSSYKLPSTLNGEDINLAVRIFCIQLWLTKTFLKFVYYAPRKALFSGSLENRLQNLFVLSGEGGAHGFWIGLFSCHEYSLDHPFLYQGEQC